MALNRSVFGLADRMNWLRWLSSQGCLDPLLTTPRGRNYSNSSFGMFPTILNTFNWALRSQRLHSRSFLRPDQSRGLPHLPCLLLNSVLLRSMPVGKMSSECNTSKFPFFRKFGINNYSEYSDLIFQQFCKGLFSNR